jgi:hypothetical protein
MDTEIAGETTALRCLACGSIVPRLMAAPRRVRSLSLGWVVREGEPICERCLTNLQEELTEEEIDRGPR